MDTSIKESTLTFGEVQSLMNAQKVGAKETEARARKAWQAICAYTEMVCRNPWPEPIETPMQDMIGDIQHVCHYLKINFEALFESGEEQGITFGESVAVIEGFSNNYQDSNTANEARAKSAWEAIVTYANNAYDNPTEKSVAEIVRALLNDVEFTCDTQGIDFQSLLKEANLIFKDELANP